jgi:hypothetical protein
MRSDERCPMNKKPVLRTARRLGIHHLAWLVLLAWVAAASAHDIPNDVKLHAYVKPAGQRLTILVRVPMIAMREVDFPTRSGGYLDLGRADPALRNAAKLWLADNLEVFEGDARLAPPSIAHARVSLPSDRSFVSFDRALVHIEGPKLPDDMALYWSHGLLDVALEYPIRSETSDFSIHPKLARLGLQVAIALRFVPASGTMRVFDLHGDPGLVRLDPRWHQAFARFVELGFTHILDGADHLLFLLCLILPFRNIRALVLIATAFTVGHSMTLMAAALGYAPQGLWFPPLVETLIAATIVYTALENIVGYKLERRWIVAFAFGLVHGLGFSFGLQQSLQLAGEHLVTSLLAFNVGIELGQLLVLVLMVPVLELVFRYVAAERVGTIIISAFIAHTAWHWMLDRAEVLGKFPPPAWDAAALAQGVRWLILGLVITAIIWLLARTLRRHSEERRRETLDKGDGP